MKKSSELLMLDPLAPTVPDRKFVFAILTIPLLLSEQCWWVWLLSSLIATKLIPLHVLKLGEVKRTMCNPTVRE